MLLFSQKNYNVTSMPKNLKVGFPKFTETVAYLAYIMCF